ncbi:adenosylcobinamide-GDP ribazoletransferase, partial [Streptomyces montanus]
ARPDGLGAAVAGTVPVRGALLAAAAVTGASAGAGALFGTYGMGTYGVETYGIVRGAVAVLAACAASELLLRHCVRRFGGVTGDVFGGLAETAATTSLLVLALN